MSHKKEYRFENRYVITGFLTVRTPLHIGSGDTTTHPKLKKEDDTNIKIAAVAKDINKKPYIPASTLKGNLRAWLATRVIDKSLLEKVFGGSHKEKNAEGGKAEFSESYIDKELTEKPELTFPYWIQEQQTGVQVGVTIDRRTRTARDEKLFYWEVVPPNVTFKVRITGQNLQDKELALLLATLDGFNHSQSPITLGSETAQNQGKMRWHSFKVQYLDAAQTIAWLKDDERKMWFENLPDIKEAKQATLIKDGEKLLYEESTRPTLRLHLQLQFDSPFLVNDPSKEVKGKHNFQPRRDANGNPLLPAKSFRGAIRSQAERIIRTLGGKACWIDEAKPACEQVEKVAEVAEVKDRCLCLACQLFGTTGWQTPIRISDFTLVHPQGKFDQDFVAIDRFTGGSCEHAKFRATVSNAPLLEGTWKIDLLRVEPWGLGLLALLIRDLMEGDVTFGYGAAKGYGHAHLEIKDYTINTLEDCFPDEDVNWQGLDPGKPQEWQNKLLRTFIQKKLVWAFRQKCKPSKEEKN